MKISEKCDLAVLGIFVITNDYCYKKWDSVVRVFATSHILKLMELAEFWKVLSAISGLHNYLEFSNHALVFIPRYANTDKC